MTKIRLALLSAACLAGMTSLAQAQETSQFEGGKICYKYQTEITQRRNSLGECMQGATVNERGQCVTNTVFYNNFAFILNDDDSMDFGFSYWFPSGANCGVTGIAVKTDDGWHYSNKTENESELCEIDITMDGQTIQLESTDGARCAAQCGVGGVVTNIQYPMEYIRSKTVYPGDLLVSNLIETGCE